MEAFLNDHWVVLATVHGFVCVGAFLGARIGPGTSRSRACAWVLAAALVLASVAGWAYEVMQPGGGGGLNFVGFGPRRQAGIPFHFTIPTMLVLGMLPALALLLPRQPPNVGLRRSAFVLTLLPVPALLGAIAILLADSFRLSVRSDWLAAVAMLGLMAAMAATVPWLAATVIHATLVIARARRVRATPVLLALSVTLASAAVGLVRHGVGTDFNAVLLQIWPSLAIGLTAGALMAGSLPILRCVRPARAQPGT